MPTINEALNKKTAQELYGLWVGKPMHDTLKPVPSFIAHVLLRDVYRMPDQEAGNLVNDLIRRAHDHGPAAAHFTTHQGKRSWLAEARNATPATMFEIREQKD